MLCANKSAPETPMELNLMALWVIYKHVENFMPYCTILVQPCLLWAVMVQKGVLFNLFLYPQFFYFTGQGVSSVA